MKPGGESEVAARHGAHRDLAGVCDGSIEFMAFESIPS
jgi:hypothetical protein